MMNILVIGNGGREHALVWKLAQSKRVKKIYCAPGNPGIAEIAECVPIAVSDTASLLLFAKQHSIELTVVGPELPLVNGIVDEFTNAGLTIFGPSKSSARLEGSKVFAKQFMQKYNIPSAPFETFAKSEYHEAKRYVRNALYPIVVKANGLAAGKGVTICETEYDARLAIEQCFKKKSFGNAGTSIVIEDCIKGDEVSLFVLTDGINFVMLPTAQDHKRIFDNDEGKNTGGMGAYSPAPTISEHSLEHIALNIIKPTLSGMRSEGNPYKGCLYIGLMLTERGPFVIEYNCRFGDPETQVILPLIEDDLAELMLEVSNGTLRKQSISIKDETALCVILASGGYPESYDTGKTISGLENIKDNSSLTLFHSGTALENNRLVTAGGRVLGVTGTGTSLKETMAKVYNAIESITFDDMHYRRDIGRKGLTKSMQMGKL